jgi:hypothetical protein
MPISLQQQIHKKSFQEMKNMVVDDDALLGPEVNPLEGSPM